MPCVRILNSTSVAGCQSLKPASGILILTETQELLDNFIKSNQAGKYVVVLPYELMTNDNLRSLESSRKMSGVLALINGTDPSSPTSSPIITRPTNLSPDEKCPNCQFDLYRNDESRYLWNPNGLGIIQESYDFPIFALYPYDRASNRTYNRIISGVQFNERRAFERFPLKTVQLESLMFAAIDAPTCLRRNFCDPIGGHSVYSTPSIDMNENDGKPIIVVSAAMDSKSLFQDITLGVNNGISGSIALIAIADALSKSQPPVKNFPKHILFTLFAGESWGFLGSQRFVKNIFEPFNCIQNNTKPTTSCGINTGNFGGCSFPCFRDLDFKRINFNNIDSIFELSSVSNGQTGVQGLNYFVHVDDENNVGNQVLIQGLRALAVGGTSVKSASEDGVFRKLPPSSSMAFLEKNRNIPAVVISDFQANLTNYNSEYDDGNGLTDADFSRITTSICSIANVTSQAIWLHAQNLLNPANPAANVPITVNCTLVRELLGCLTINGTCSLFDAFSDNNDKRISHYTGVFDPTSPALLPLFHYNVLGSINANLTSNRGCQDDGDCQFGEICANLNCTNSFTRFHHSYGVGLEFNEKGEAVVVDPEKATWVESGWSGDFDFQIFNSTSTGSQIGELLTGILVTVLSIIGIIFGKKYIRKTLKLD
ncbi:Nicastrin-domain-containing protein [Glomus cerebriforme]|uniref:Nicastrin n=1 Tax=Glomus cerebriforme TaxID=658196 RepID=A0A397TT83_9GLOM|nr:Nicastrin-domain-containing protein [Glomus cerebriforme]